VSQNHKHTHPHTHASAHLTPAQSGIHVAIIMDGNGRWATARGRPRTAGHVAGARVVRKIVEAAPDCGIGMLTLYAFSADNWTRPSREVALLMRLFRRYLVAETDRCVTNDVRMRIIGRRDRIPSELLRAINAAEEATKHGRRLDLRIAAGPTSPPPTWPRPLRSSTRANGGSVPFQRQLRVEDCGLQRQLTTLLVAASSKLPLSPHSAVLTPQPSLRLTLMCRGIPRAAVNSCGGLNVSSYPGARRLDVCWRGWCRSGTVNRGSLDPQPSG
jgi:hypothetical protein